MQRSPKSPGPRPDRREVIWWVAVVVVVACLLALATWAMGR